MFFTFAKGKQNSMRDRLVLVRTNPLSIITTSPKIKISTNRIIIFLVKFQNNPYRQTSYTFSFHVLKKNEIRGEIAKISTLPSSVPLCPIDGPTDRLLSFIDLKIFPPLQLVWIKTIPV